MSATATITEQWSDGKRLHAVGTIAFSGNYATGGDTLDLSKVFSQSNPIFVAIRGISGFVYEYVKGASKAAGKVKIFTNTAGGTNAALDEHTAAAVVAGVTGDTISFHAIFPKF